MYVGYMGIDANPRTFDAVLGLGVIAALYHGVKLYQSRHTIPNLQNLQNLQTRP